MFQNFLFMFGEIVHSKNYLDHVSELLISPCLQQDYSHQ